MGEIEASKLDMESLRLLFLNICIFRLGGQVSIDAEDILEAMQTIAKSRILLVPIPDKGEYKFVLKTVLLRQNDENV
jgi:hypothetical protein